MKNLFCEIQNQMFSELVDSAIETASDDDKVLFIVIKRSRDVCDLLRTVLDIVEERMDKNGLEDAREVASAYNALLDVVEAQTKIVIDEYSI